MSCTYSMKLFLANRKSKVIIGVEIVAITISLISKKVINNLSCGCTKGVHKLIFYKELNKLNN